VLYVPKTLEKSLKQNQ